MLSMGEWADGRWKPPIVSTAAVARDRAGLDELTERIGQHQDWLDSSGGLTTRRQTRAREEIAAIAVAVLRERMGALPGDQRIAELAARVAAGETDPYTAADELVSG
jgi:LAO/AO transport system kinase